MSRKKKTSRHLTKATTRLAALKSIEDLVELGGGLSVPKYEIAIKDLETKLQAYNTNLSVLDEQLNIVKESERSLKDLSERMLTGVATKYSKNSNEYEKAGGRKKSERKQPKRKADKAKNKAA